MTIPEKVLKAALSLNPTTKAELVDQLLCSIDKPNKEIDALWAKEAESRITAYEQGELKSIPLQEVLKKYN